MVHLSEHQYLFHRYNTRTLKFSKGLPFPPSKHTEHIIQYSYFTTSSTFSMKIRICDLFQLQLLNYVSIRMSNSLVYATTFFLLLVCCKSACPSSCNCQVVTLQCLVCLQGYHRVYSNQGQKCICEDGFIEMDPPASHCCPSNCSTCVDLGCVACHPTWQLSYNPAVEVYICVCKIGYFFDGTDCICESKYSPTVYYEDKINSNCLRCPEGCVCGTVGCVSCEGRVGRQILTVNGMSRCPCMASKYQLANGSCVCKRNCDCVGDVCGEGTLRYWANGDYVCVSPFVDKNGECVCEDPYTTNLTGLSIQANSSQCYCLSVLNPTLYYEYFGQCTRCNQGCICNQSGCVFCPWNLNRQVVYFSCPCLPPYTQFKGKCICKQPYYQTPFGQCYCKSKVYPDKYFGDNTRTTTTCYRCPDGCTCDSSGCNSCQASALRNITFNSLGSYTCKCVESATEDAYGNCKCNQFSKAEDGKCVCLSGVEVFRQIDLCQTCPDNCNCTPAKGCYECAGDSRRIIVSDNEGYSSCICSPDTTQNSEGFCECRFPYTSGVDPSTGTKICECLEPYVVNNGMCACKSVIDPSSYYLNTILGVCYKCPVGCSCNYLGCYSCSPNSLHYVFISDGLYQCACIQSARLSSQICQKCSVGSYYLNGECVTCPSCSECDMYGCTKCGENARLDNHTCICNYSNYVNMNGICNCPPGKYQAGTNICNDCPPNCFDCHYNSSNKTTFCNSCPTNMNRRDSPADGCPCLDHYKQLPNIKSYCCHETCSNCNQTTCTQCFMFTFRTLVNGTCVCHEGTYQINNSVSCGCPDGMYMLLGKCMECPLNCETCYFDAFVDLVYCKKCREDVNRNTTLDRGISVCPCLDVFTEAYPVQPFCVPLYCKAQTRRCTECNYGRIVGNNGKSCLCKEGFYQNMYGECTSCNMEGCLVCSRFNFCLKCDNSMGYFLTGTTCKKNMQAKKEYIFSQTQSGIFLQLNLTNVNLSEFNNLVSIDARLDVIYSQLESNGTIAPAVVLNITQSKLDVTGNILVLKAKNPNQTKRNSMLSVQYYLNKKNKRMLTYIGFDQRGNPTAYIESSYLKLDLIRSQNEIDISNKWYYGFEYAITIIFMIGALVLYVMGFKHNQIPFFMQTLSFLGFIFHDESLTFVSALYNLKFSYYQFGNALSSIIPTDYLQTSYANYSLLAIDSNIFRLAGTTLLIALLTSVFVIVFRVIEYVHGDLKKCRQYWVDEAIRSHKKTIYRVLEFFYKTCMYPLIYFSVVTLSNWNATVFVYDNGFQNACRILAICLLLIYSLSTAFSLYIQTIAKINKFQNTIQFLTCLLCSLIISFSYFSNHFLWVVGMFITRAVLYLLIRKRYLRDFNKVEYLRILSLGFEVSCICCVLTQNSKVIVPMFLVTVVSQAVHSAVVVYVTNRKAQVDKRTGWGTESQINTAEEKERELNSDADRFDKASNKVHPIILLEEELAAVQQAAREAKQAKQAKLNQNRNTQNQQAFFTEESQVGFLPIILRNRIATKASMHTTTTSFQ